MGGGGGGGGGGGAHLGSPSLASGNLLTHAPTTLTCLQLQLLLFMPKSCTGTSLVPRENGGYMGTSLVPRPERERRLYGTYNCTYTLAT